jgi:hypothetical protein
VTPPIGPAQLGRDGLRNLPAAPVQPAPRHSHAAPDGASRRDVGVTDHGRSQPCVSGPLSRASPATACTAPWQATPSSASGGHSLRALTPSGANRSAARRSHGGLLPVRLRGWCRARPVFGGRLCVICRMIRPGGGSGRDATPRASTTDVSPHQLSYPVCGHPRRRCHGSDSGICRHVLGRTGALLRLWKHQPRAHNVLPAVPLLTSRQRPPRPFSRRIQTLCCRLSRTRPTWAGSLPNIAWWMYAEHAQYAGERKRAAGLHAHPRHLP